jgi:flavodoxin
MKIAIVYDSSTGTTAKAAETMGKEMEAHGHQCRVQSVAQSDPADVSEADLICVGSWVKGLFIIRQHPTEGTMRFIEQLGDLSGKSVVVFCTYKLAIGSTMHQMTKALEEKGAKVVRQFKYRGPEPNSKFASFAASLS